MIKRFFYDTGFRKEIAEKFYEIRPKLKKNDSKTWVKKASAGIEEYYTIEDAPKK